MKFRFTIARKLFVGFGILTIAFLFNTYMTFQTLSSSREVNEKINNIYAPSAALITDFEQMISSTKLLTLRWTTYQSDYAVSPDKMKLMKIRDVKFFELRDSLLSISEEWQKNQRELLKTTLKAVKDTLFPMQKENVIVYLQTFEDYNSDMNVLFAEEGAEAVIKYIDKHILNKIQTLKVIQNTIEQKARENMVDSLNDFQRTIIILSIILIVALLSIAIITTRTLVRPIKYMKNVLMSMSKGIMPKERIRSSNDEIGEMAKALNALIQGLRQISEFAVAIGQGNFNKEFKPLSDEDNLGYSILEMRDNLKVAAEEEERRKEEDKHRSWSTNGIAMFSDILREDNDDLEKLSYKIISKLVKYLEIEQGGLFIINDNDPDNVFIELKGCYAYDRQKYLQKSIQIGVGTVGRCVQEQNVIYMTEIPEDYLNIRSGLGEEKPAAILIVPMILNDVVYGVLELASFKEIENYKIDFTKRLAESIASTIASVKTALKTNQLLETTRRQAEEMAQQEEEMRQNMEELQATQEESLRREDDLREEIKDLKNRMNDN